VLDPLQDLTELVEAQNTFESHQHALDALAAGAPHAEIGHGVPSEYVATGEIVLDMHMAPVDAVPAMHLPASADGLTVGDVFTEVPLPSMGGLSGAHGMPVSHGDGLPPEGNESSGEPARTRLADDEPEPYRREAPVEGDRTDLDGPAESAAEGLGAFSSPSAADADAAGVTGFVARLWGLVRGLGHRSSRKSGG